MSPNTRKTNKCTHNKHFMRNIEREKHMLINPRNGEQIEPFIALCAPPCNWSISKTKTLIDDDALLV